MEAPESVFTGIYQNGVWTNGSGSGSIPENTPAYRTFLEGFLRGQVVTRVLDLGCGDWQSSRLINWDGVSYIGVDVVRAVIEENVRKYQEDNVRFMYIDILHDPLPPADLIIIKDVFQHWPNDAICSFAPLLRKYPCALITNTLETHDVSTTERKRLDIPLNQDIPMGGMRPIDLSLPPFSWSVVEVFRHVSYRKIAKAEEVKTTVMLANSVVPNA
jgi:SAM-dependent methyltransferase